MYRASETLIYGGEFMNDADFNEKLFEILKETESFPQPDEEKILNLTRKNRESQEKLPTKTEQPSAVTGLFAVRDQVSDSLTWKQRVAKTWIYGNGSNKIRRSSSHLILL